MHARIMLGLYTVGNFMQYVWKKSKGKLDLIYNLDSAN